MAIFFVAPSNAILLRFIFRILLSVIMVWRAHFNRVPDVNLALQKALSMWLKKQFGGRQAGLGQLGNLESELMERVWRCGEISVRVLHGEFASRLAYTTVMTTMDRLYKKGLLRRRKVGKAYVYVAALTEKEYQERLTHHLFSMVLHDGKNSSAVLSNFVDAVSAADEKLLDRLDQLVKAKKRTLRRSEAS
jgi:predicted transcriptional regulator